MSQRVPNVGEHDVWRVLQRDYGHADLAELRAAISGIDVREKWRVVLACLKNGAGDITRLRGELHNAEGWWREIISEAEYPEAYRKLFRMDKFSEAEREAIYEKDWRQYEAWLSRLNP